MVLDTTEVPTFLASANSRTAVVQEEESLNAPDTARTHWFALDKTTNSVYSFGEVSWNINGEGKRFSKAVAGGRTRRRRCRRTGVVDARHLHRRRRLYNRGARHGLWRPENMEAGIEIAVPAGTYKAASGFTSRVWSNSKDITDKIGVRSLGRN